MRKISLIILLFVSSINLIAQVAIHPKAIFIDKYTRSASMQVINTSNTAKEITIELKFGHTEYDTSGLAYIGYPENGELAQFSAIPYTKVFPQKLVIEPKGSQTIRFIVPQISSMDDGVYWSRVVVSSEEAEKQIDSTTDLTKLSVGIAYKLTVVSALFIKIGETTAPIKINGGTSYSDSTQVHLLVDIEKGGNSPYWGTEDVEIYNASGKKIAEKKGMIAIYFSAKKGYEFDKSDFPAGKYRAEIELENNHPAIPEKYRPKSDTVKASFYFEVTDE